MALDDEDIFRQLNISNTSSIISVGFFGASQLQLGIHLEGLLTPSFPIFLCFLFQ